MLALIGSAALNIVLGRQVRTPRDYDLVGTVEEAVGYAKAHGQIRASYPINDGKTWVFKCGVGAIVELEIAWPGSLGEELNSLIINQPGKRKLDQRLADLDTLYMLKMSHRYRKNSPHFLKTMRDIQLMRKEGAVIRPEHQDFYERRMKATYDYAHPKLDVSKADFFKGDGIEYVYDHDSIHEAMKHGNWPAYTAYMDGEAEVKTSRALFEDLPVRMKLHGVLEEAYVLALERSIVPHPGAMTDKAAFDYALMKVCTSITSGWFREYAWEHYDQVQELYDPAYTVRFWNAVKNGVVKKL